jgi:hypothetical protein
MVRLTVESAIAASDNQTSGSGAGHTRAHTLNEHETEWDSITTRHNQNGPGGRRNEIGWQVWNGVMWEIQLAENVRETVKNTCFKETLLPAANWQ